MTEFAFIIPLSDPDELENKNRRAKNIARGVMRRSNDWFGQYYDGVAIRDDVETFVPVESEAGENLIADLLEKTRKAKGKHLKKILSAVEEAGSPEEAIKSEKVFHSARRIGSWRQPSGFLIDATHWSHGEPILSQEKVNEIIDNKSRIMGDSETLYLANVDAQY